MAKPASKKLSLNDLSRQLPTTDELTAVLGGMDSMDARAAALVITSLIDALLERAINLNFVVLGEDQFRRLFRNPTAPLSSFSSKIAVAHALGVFGDELRTQLDRVRSVRNAFAHAIRPIDFDEPTIAAECRKLEPSRLTDMPYQAEHETPRERFTVVATMVATHLLRYGSATALRMMAEGPRQQFPDKFVVTAATDGFPHPRGRP